MVLKACGKGSGRRSGAASAVWWWAKSASVKSPEASARSDSQQIGMDESGELVITWCREVLPEKFSTLDQPSGGYIECGGGKSSMESGD